MALDSATTPFRGPHVPSDRRLHRGSIVYYRYGAFRAGYDIQTPKGEILSALVGPSGQLVPDVRGQQYAPPEWAEDPFEAAGVAEPLSTRSPLIAGRYLVVGSVHRSVGTAVQMAVDLVERRTCVLKRAHAGTMPGHDGRDSGDRLRHEAEIMGRVSGVSGCVQRLGTTEQDGELVLVLEDVEGETLEKHVSSLATQWGLRPREEQLVSWASDLAVILGDIHCRGVAHRDVKPGNVIVRPDGALCVIDFNVARTIDHDGPSGDTPQLEGTWGYMSPQQVDGAPASVADDVYGLGCLLYFAATGAQATQIPQPAGRLLERPITILRPDLSRHIVDVIETCLHPDPAVRHGSMREVARALTRANAGPEPTMTEGTAVGAVDEWQTRYRELATRLAHTLVGAGRPSPGGAGLAWLGTHASARGFRSRDLGTGTAGAVLALAELAAGLELLECYEALAEGAAWLAVAPPPGGPLRPGLYVGEAGIGAALLRAGQVLGSDRYLEASLQRGRVVAELPYGSPDIYNGTAGRLRFHQLLYDATGEAECVRHARAAADALVDAGEDDPGGGFCWRIPEGYDDMTGQTFLGYAHGAAGIADALLDLIDTTGDTRYLPAVRGAGRWLRAQAHEVLDDGSGLSWPHSPAGPLAIPAWCHGSAGIGQFFIHAAEDKIFDGASEVAARAGRATALLARTSGPVQCHGLAGNIEFLLDMHQATGQAVYLADALSFAALLMAFAIEHDCHLAWCGDYPTLITPDYMTGYAGVAVTLLRLTDAARRPRQLSRAGFDWVPSGTPA